MLDRIGKEVTLGNIISWGVILTTAAFIYGSLSNTVENAVLVNKHQEETINRLQETLTDLKVSMAVNNSELKQIRQAMERVEKGGYFNGR